MSELATGTEQMAAIPVDNTDAHKAMRVASLVEDARHRVSVAIMNLQYRNTPGLPTGIPLYCYGLCTATSKDLVLAAQDRLASYVEQEIPRIWNSKLYVSDSSRRGDGSRFTLYMSISKCTERGGIES